MAIEKSLAKRTLSVNVKDGVNSDGSDKIKACNYSKIKADATVENIFAAVTALGSLMAQEVVDIALTEKATLTEVM